jgi:nicotinate dehydrogenase subunit B
VQSFTLNVNGQNRVVTSEPDTPLLFILRNDLGLIGTKYGCGSEQCGVCKVIVDDQAVPTCKLPVEKVEGLAITTIEGLGSPESLNHLQQAFVQAQAFQCGYCTPGMIMTAQALLKRSRYPQDQEIRSALEKNLCRCGSYDRVRRAIKLAVGRPERSPGCRVQESHTSKLQGKNLPDILQKYPDLDSWLQINNDGTITVHTGKVELGQGIKTALAVIVAEELDVSVDRIHVAPTDSSYSPDEGLTVSSMSLETTGEALRWAAAEARNTMLSVAFEELEAPLERLRVSDGTILDPVSGKSTDYWRLFGERTFGGQVTGAAAPKPAGSYALLGGANQRLDAADKVSGQTTFVPDLVLPGMAHGRVLRPANQSARLASFDERQVHDIPGLLKVVHNGNFLGVICAEEYQAIHAVEQLEQAAQWDSGKPLPHPNQIEADLHNQTGQSFLVEEGTGIIGSVPPIETPAGATQTLTATYFRPFQMHASLAPSAAVALMEAGSLTLWVHSQGVYPIRSAVARVLDLTIDQVRVIHMESSGCYGHNGADDAALDAALLARALPGKPVSVKWTREDENTWEPYAPAMRVQLQASLDSSGKVIAWNHDLWSYPHFGRSHSGSDISGLLAAWHLAEPYARPTHKPVLAYHVGSHRNADPLYSFYKKRIVKHFVPESPFRTSSLRGLGAFANVFAIESFMDELAHAAGIDPLVFRLNHLEDERARAVLRAAAQGIGWDSRRGIGIAFARYKNRQSYAAVAVELEMDTSSGEIYIERAVIAADAGQIVSADGLSNQLEGGFTQSASWTLKEEVRFDHGGITSRDWDSYPIMNITRAPRVETILIDRPGAPFLGAGEAAQGPTPAAIANAVYAAAGIRLRHLPFTPIKVLSALNSL